MVWCLYPQRLAAWLIESGADPNEMDDSGQTALHTAMEYDNFAVVSTLARKGGDVNLKRRCDGRSVVRTLRRRGCLIELYMRARGFTYMRAFARKGSGGNWETNTHPCLMLISPRLMVRRPPGRCTQMMSLPLQRPLSANEILLLYLTFNHLETFPSSRRVSWSFPWC